MSEEERFKDQVAVALFAKGKDKTREGAKAAYDGAEILVSERTARRAVEGCVLTGVELVCLREAIQAIDEDYSETFRPSFTVAMMKRGMAKVGIEVALRKILGDS
jgi:hypothetical protein